MMTIKYDNKIYKKYFTILVEVPEYQLFETEFAVNLSIYR